MSIEMLQSCQVVCTECGSHLMVQLKQGIIATHQFNGNCSNSEKQFRVPSTQLIEVKE
jgi:hypothetical protein